MTGRAISDASSATGGRRHPAIYREKFARNPFTNGEQERIRTSLFAVIGLGGTGGFMLENLLRMGAERFLIFEDDWFELSNFNRQILASQSEIDRPKSDAALSRARAINPDAELHMRGRFSARSSIRGARIVLDGSDDVATKAQAAQASAAAKVPYVFCSAGDTRGIVSVFRGYGFRKAFQLQQKGKGANPPDRYKACPRIMCPAAAISGSIAASQAVNAILGKPIILAPEAQFFDLSRKDPFWRARLG